MKLEFVEMCGFRGFRDKIRVEFGSGFTIVSGRNGVGKSTICDAIEFALTGTIDKYRVEKAASESLTDYVWWRGKGQPERHYVRLALAGEDEGGLVVTRSREGGCDRSAQELEAVLCSSPCPENALALLCRTSIVRDEWISALSVDMTETERFKLVRSALGTSEGTDLGERAKQVLSRVESMVRQRREVYERTRREVADSMSERSAVETTVGRTGDIPAARKVVADAIQDVPEEMSEQLRLAREALVQGRARVARMGEAIQQGQELAELREVVRSVEFEGGYKQAERELATATERTLAAERSLEEAERQMAAEQEADQLAVSLLALAEHAAHVGLHDSQCPICSSEVTIVEFQAGLASARRRAQALAAGASLVTAALRDAQNDAQLEREKQSQAREAWMAYAQQRQRLAEEEEAYEELLGELDLDGYILGELMSLRTAREAERGSLIDLERALVALEASQFVGRIVRIDESISLFRDEAEEAAKELRRWEGALEDAKALERAVRRVNAEVVEERLANISPLLNELYQRLRPHTDWHTIDYRIRGDVRRFLRLQVGDGLNPQFVLSSGQRRAVGLAFLLSIHMARRWTDWRTLLLDDPVQHIDDFRSLHFVEILSAMRLDDRQIVCTVEDEALADLLCRRLSNTPEEGGRRYEIGVDAKGGTVVVRDEYVAPLPTRALRHSA